jgi:hypothetical protein
VGKKPSGATLETQHVKGFHVRVDLGFVLISPPASVGMRLFNR